MDDISRPGRANNTLPWFLLLLFGAAIIRYSLFVGIVGSDDVSVARYSLNILESGPYVPGSHYAARVGLIYPQALIFYIFGVGDWQFAIIPFLSSILGVCLAFLIASHYGGSKVGLLAGALIAVFPLDICFSSQLLPDLPLGTLLSLSFYLLLKSESPGKNNFAWAVGAGIVWGIAYLVKVEAFFFLFVILFLLFFRQLSVRTGVYVALSVGAIVMSEFIAYWYVSGDPLLRVHVATIQGGGRMIKEYSMTQLWVFPKAWFITPYYFGLHYYFLVLSLLWLVWKKRFDLLVFSVWIIVFLLWLQFGGNPFSESYHIKSHLLRYCNMINVPMAVLLAFFLNEGLKTISQKIFRIGIFVIMFASLFFAPFNQLNFEAQIATKRLLDTVETEKLSPVYMDRTSYNLATFYLFEEANDGLFASLQKHNFKTMKTELLDPEQGKGYVLINRGFVDFGYNRYRVDKITPQDYQADFQIYQEVNNPASKYSYLSARLFKLLAAVIPVDFLRNKIQGTALDLLKGHDAVLMSPR